MTQLPRPVISRVRLITYNASLTLSQRFSAARCENSDKKNINDICFPTGANVVLSQEVFLASFGVELPDDAAAEALHAVSYIDANIHALIALADALDSPATRPLQVMARGQWHYHEFRGCSYPVLSVNRQSAWSITLESRGRLAAGRQLLVARQSS